MVINTCPLSLNTQKRLVSTLLDAHTELPEQDKRQLEGLLDWLQELVDNYYHFEQKSVELNFVLDL